jgi:signal transduction histidine kinase
MISSTRDQWKRERDKILSIIEDAASFVEELKEDTSHHDAELLEHISARIESLFSTEEVRVETINLDECLDELCAQAITSMRGRDLTIARHIERDITLTMDRGVLEKSFLGILKNAIENTPDEGKIEFTAFSKDGEIRIEVHDYGVGITEENQKLIFGGFFHTQDTQLYSSKRPYEFNAGGTGLDLLRIKSLSEWWGFSVDFESTWCRFIPTDNDRCSGRISTCPFITDKSECFSSGGSLFSLTFPAI